MPTRSPTAVPAPPAPSPEPLDGLRRLRDQHPIWQGRLLKACQAGGLGKAELAFVFSQYYLYSRSFTRYLAGLMSNCPDDLFRAQLSENLWEEGGGAEPERRHAELFRRFLRQGLGVGDLEGIVYQDYTRHFVNEYLAHSRQSDLVVATAFLSLGTEGLVPRLYATFLGALEEAGVESSQLEFFRLHIDCDDAHARTLEAMLLAQLGEPGWEQRCRQGMLAALDLRERFFDNLFDSLSRQRVSGLLERIQARQSLLGPRSQPLTFRPQEDGQPLYSNRNERLNIDFAVRCLELRSQALDARVVRVESGRNNERHRHAHESLFYVLGGQGRLVVDDREYELRQGEVGFVARWAFHQMFNPGPEPLTFLAITDYPLTSLAFLGNYEETARPFLPRRKEQP